MTNGGSAIDSTRAAAPAQPGTWAWHPPLPLGPVPIFVWPPRPVAALRYLVSLTFLGSIMAPFGALAALSWFHLQPALERCAELRADWIFQMYARNLALMLLVAGGLHLWFYVLKRQGVERKYDPRGLEHERLAGSSRATRCGTTCSGRARAGSPCGRHTRRDSCGRTQTTCCRSTSAWTSTRCGSSSRCS